MKEKDARLVFIQLFNGGQYFEAHEALEAFWLKEQGKARKFYQGLIQIAAVFVHLQRKNAAGARTMLQKAGANLEPYAPAYLGLDVSGLLQDVNRCVQKRITEYHLKWSPNEFEA